jgi:hypothetical protein
MCEINPKRKKFFKLEFFTTAEMSNEEWFSEIYGNILALEQTFNKKGNIRVHVHQEETDSE